MDFVKFLFVIFKVCWFIKSSLARAHREQIQTRGVLNSYKKSPSVFAYQNKLYKKKILLLRMVRKEDKSHAVILILFL